MEEVSPVDTEESLIQTLSGEFVGNDKTKFGTAYHSLIEGDYIFNREEKSFKVGDFVFSSEQAYPGLSYKASHQSMVHEMVASKIYETKYGQIQVSGRIDGIEGLFVRDIKTKFRTPKDQEYRDSLQWRHYLIMLGLDIFFFDLFEVRGFEALPFNPPYQFGEVSIIPHEPIECNRYEGMEDDVLNYLNLFLDYVHLKNFHHYLKPALEHEDFIF